MTEIQSINTSNMEIENQQQESNTKLLTVKSMNNIEEIQTIIFDLGSYNYRIGYSGNDRPSFIFPPIKFNEKDDYEFLTSQKGDGFFNDIKKFEDFFDDFISDKELNTSLNQGSILFSEPIIHNKEQRKSLTEFLFEKYEIGGLFFCNNSVLSSFSYGKSSCLVFDSGHSQSNVVPVHDGMIIKNAFNNFNLCGKNIEDIIINEFIKKKNIKWDDWNILQKIQIISDIKDIIFTPDDDTNKNYILPDKKNIEIDEEFISYMKEEISLSELNTTHRLLIVIEILASIGVLGKYLPSVSIDTFLASIA